MSEPTTTAVARTGVAGVKLALSQPAFAKRFEEILGKRAPQFMASIVAIASTMPQDTEPTSIITSAMVAATLDLPIQKDLGFAWVIAYKNKDVRQAQFQMGYKGFVQLALRSGQYHRINARCINEEALGGFDEIGEPLIDWSKIDSSKPTVGYAVAWKLTNGFTKVCYWSRGRVEEHAKRYSQAYSKGYDTPWKTHFDQMALKTVIKNEISDWGILSIEMQRAARFDQGIVIDVDSDSVAYPDGDVTQEVPRAEATPGPAPAKAPFRRGEKATVATTGPSGKSDPRDEKTPTTPEPNDNDGDLGPQPTNVVDVTSRVQQQETKPVEPKAPAFEVPPAKTPADWLPFIDPADAPSVIESLHEWIAFEEITEDELIAWFRRGKYMNDKQSKLSELAGGKLTGVLKNREKVRVEILTERAAK